VERLGRCCFANCQYLSHVTFEADSRLTHVEDSAFLSSSLPSICLPSSVERLERRCFSRCLSLREVRFAPGSHLQEIEPLAFDESYFAHIVPADGRSFPAWRFALGWNRSSPLSRLIVWNGK
jgi:hypothetical protein